ncbi:MAG: response regulator transcription factor [Leptospiraceae bacterium]|nr:response regulator transcription factor [Leptospiraceae bacterium]
MKVYLVDDHAILREGLKLILRQIDGVVIIGESGEGRLALEEIDRIKPDVVILDVSLPGMSGVEIARHLRRYNKMIKIIILSRHDGEEYITELLKIGINAYVLKDEAGEDLIRAIEAVRRNEQYLSPRITSKVMNAIQNSKPSQEITAKLFDILTNREREILKLIAEGNSNEEIGTKLWIATQTVKVHRQNIMKKLNIHNVAELVKYAIKSGIIET